MSHLATLSLLCGTLILAAFVVKQRGYHEGTKSIQNHSSQAKGMKVFI